jgi:fructosamine-3-kinase
MKYWQTITDHISQITNQPFHLHHYSSIGGGCINSSYRLTHTNGQQYFIKLNTPDLEPMFQAEFFSLKELAQQLHHSQYCGPQCQDNPVKK